jgi:hypothetical protein
MIDRLPPLCDRYPFDSFSVPDGNLPALASYKALSFERAHCFRNTGPWDAEPEG